MRICMWFVVLVGSLAVCVAAPKEGVNCNKYGLPCKIGKECCGGCCHQGRCVPHSYACAVADSACRFHDCLPPKVCYLQEVQCLQSPCNPIPACRAPESDYD